MKSSFASPRTTTKRRPREEEGAEEAERCRAGKDLVCNLGARAARQLLQEGVRQDGELQVDGERQRRPEEKRGGGDNEDVLRTETGGDGLEPRFGAVGAKEAGGILDAALRQTGAAGGLERDCGVSGGLELEPRASAGLV